MSARCPVCDSEIDPRTAFDIDRCPKCERPVRDLFAAAVEMEGSR